MQVEIERDEEHRPVQQEEEEEEVSALALLGLQREEEGTHRPAKAKRIAVLAVEPGVGSG